MSEPTATAIAPAPTDVERYQPHPDSPPALVFAELEEGMQVVIYDTPGHIDGTGTPVRDPSVERLRGTVTRGIHPFQAAAGDSCFIANGTPVAEITLDDGNVVHATATTWNLGLTQRDGSQVWVGCDYVARADD